MITSSDDLDSIFPLEQKAFESESIKITFFRLVYIAYVIWPRAATVKREAIYAKLDAEFSFAVRLGMLHYSL